MRLHRLAAGRLLRLIAFGFFAALSLPVPDVAAADLTFVLATGEREPVKAKLTAEPFAGRGEAVVRDIDLAGITTLALGEGMWAVRLEAEGFWAAPRVLRHTDSSTFRVWPTVAISGETNVSALRVAFKLLGEEGAEGEVTCPVEQRRWTCHLPAGRHELRFSSPKHASELRSPFDVMPGMAPVSVMFVAGASLSGATIAARGLDATVEDIEVTLTPGEGTDAGARLVATTNADGFFQFKGVAPGDYTLRARKGGLTARTQSIDVIEGVSAELREPLLLDRPKTLKVVTMPPRDPAGKPWHVTLLEVDSRANSVDTVSESAVSEIGEWAHGGVVAGEYIVTIKANEGSQWKLLEVNVAEEDLTLPVSLLPERVSGRITLGDRPLAAKLSFGGEKGPALRSDEEGHFAGEIAPVGESEDFRILVKADTPDVRRWVKAKPRRTDSGELHFEIELPATTLTGRVVNEDGSPARYPLLSVKSDDGGPTEQSTGEEDGSFQIAGLDTGKYRIKAEMFQHESKPASVTLTEESPTEVTLVVEREVQVRGRMVVGNRPVIHAKLLAIERDGWHPLVRQAKTDAMGRFLLRLAPGTTVFDVLAVHPAFDVIMARAKVEKDARPMVQVRQIGGTLTIESRRAPEELEIRHDGAQLTVALVAGQAGGTLSPGRITIPRLEAGEYSVCGRKSGKCASGYVPPHGMLTLSVE